MKKITITILISFLFFPIISFAKIDNLAQKLSGKILLQIESHGEAWYINQADQKRYSLGRPTEAWTIMRNLSFGITNENLLKIPVGVINANAPDNDKDGLSNNLESALGTNPDDSDSDKDGYNDLTELKNNYDPLCPNNLPLPIDINFTKQHLGKIFLQIENKGEAWYINPTDKKRYFLGRPEDAFAVMKKLSLGITNKNLNKIPIKQTTEFKLKTKTTTTIIQQSEVKSIDDLTIMEQASTAIRNNDQVKAKSFFTPSMEKIIEYTLNSFNQESRLMLANILSGSNLTISTPEQKIYSAKVYFSMGGYEVPVKFYVQKQPDGQWLIMNL
ncbi:MAG: hypothetical protein AAB530_01885 [Patescibacteria group bacterium]